MFDEYYRLRDSIPSTVKLVAVTKFKPLELVSSFYAETGHKVLGENRAQEFLTKVEALPKDIEWHFIGHLQTNKVKLILPHAHLIHGVDSARLLREIDHSAGLLGLKSNVLLQFHIAEESTKFGFSKEELQKEIDSGLLKDLRHVNICGVMGMASFVDDERQVRSEFRHLKNIFDNLKSAYFSDSVHFKELSMGMSGDYQLAVEEGSTIIRIGTLLFGERA